MGHELRGFFLGLRFGVCRASDFGFRVCGLGFRVRGLGSRSCCLVVPEWQQTGQDPGTTSHKGLDAMWTSK